MKDNQNEIRVLLHNIRSAHNVGSIFRTGDAIGVSRIYLSGFTPAPLDRFGRSVKEISKTALGAENSISWDYDKKFDVFITKARNEEFTIIGLEQNERSEDYKQCVVKGKILVVLGSEVDGMSAELMNSCDSLLEIPMVGSKESLNVSVAFGIAMFRLFDK